MTDETNEYKDVQKRLAEQEEEIETLREQLRKMMPSRRDFLKAGAGAAVATGVMGQATAAPGDDGDTVWGSDTNRDDYLADEIDANSIDADDAVITNWRQTATFTLFDDAGTVKAMNPHGNVKHTGSDPGAVINSCIQDLPNYPGQTPASGPDVAGGWRIHLTDYFTGVATKIVVPGNGDFDSNYATVEITGEGLGTGLQMANGANLSPMIEWERKETSGQAHGHALRNLMLEGNKSNNTSGTANETVLPSGYSGTLGDCYFENLFVLNFAGQGLDISGISDVKYVDNVLVEGCGDTGIFDGGGRSFMNNIVSGSNAGHGIRLNGTLTNGYIWGNDTHGIVTLADSSIYNTTLSSNNASGGSNASVTMQNGCEAYINVNNDQPGGTPQYIVDYFGSDASVWAQVNTSPSGSLTNGRSSGDGNRYNGEGTESANAEEPDPTNWPPGTWVAFSDTGDGSGTGYYYITISGAARGPI